MESGIGKIGDRISFTTKKKNIIATITFIELNRKPTSETIIGPEIGLLLDNFNDSKANNLKYFNLD